MSAATPSAAELETAGASADPPCPFCPGGKALEKQTILAKCGMWYAVRSDRTRPGAALEIVIACRHHDSPQSFVRSYADIGCLLDMLQVLDLEGEPEEDCELIIYMNSASSIKHAHLTVIWAEPGLEPRIVIE